MLPYVNPSGEQYEIRFGAWRAVVTEVGATLRELTLHAQAVIDGFGVRALASGGRGQVLAPWPNRIRDGRYSFRGVDLQLPLSEPSRLNASHGLVRWSAWSVLEAATSFARLGYVLHPQPGYPFRLRLSVRYSLGESGLAVEFLAVNEGTSAAPFGVGFHPYLVAGSGPVDGWRLLVPAAEVLVTDERMIPVGRTAVAGDRFDFRTAREIGPLRLDTCFTALERDPQGRAAVGVEGRRRLVVWMDAGFSHVMVFSGDGLPERARRGLAVEPMTCAPDAFNSGDGVRVLEPGESAEFVWGITLG